ncbi:MAG: nucleoside hydrolase [Fimbriimonadaceae bacterium]
MEFQPLSPSEVVQRLTERAPGPLPVVLDTDTANEIDDQFALTWAALSPDAIDLRAVHVAPFFNERSTSPADGQEKSFAEARRVLESIGRSDVPVMPGARDYLPNRETPLDTPAVRDLVERAMSVPTDGPPLYVATIGCLTNVASAVLLEPRIVTKIVVAMLAGKDFERGDAAEFNLQQDIPAVQVLFESGVPIVHFPTTRVAIHLGLTYPEVLAYVKDCGAIGSVLSRLYEEQCDLTPGSRRPIWDLAPIAWLVHSGFADTTLIPRPRLTACGRWSPDPFGLPVLEATGLNTSGIYRDLFRKLALLRG